MIKKWVFAFLFLLIIDCVWAQSNELTSYNQQRLQITRIGMLTLGGWAVGNMAISGALLVHSSGPRYYFHQMNVFWNVVNLGLSGFGYYQAFTSDPTTFSLSESIQEQFGMEKLLLFNAGLDVAYLVSGFYLLERSRRNTLQAIRWKGYGQSIILQGGFLLAFDTILYLILHQQNSILFSFLAHIKPTFSGVGLICSF